MPRRKKIHYPELNHDKEIRTDNQVLSHYTNKKHHPQALNGKELSKHNGYPTHKALRIPFISLEERL